MGEARIRLPHACASTRSPGVVHSSFPVVPMKEHEHPVMPLKSRISLVSVEYGAVDRDGSALVLTAKGRITAQLPVGATAVLMLEPGTSITHEAVKLCAESRTLILWTGEAGVRIYSAAQEGAAHTYRLLRQARLALDRKTRLAVAREMYRVRFGETAPERRSIEQLRGMEGARVRARYRELSQQYQVRWSGRDYDRSDWGSQDPINRALSAANSCLYGLCHAAILIAGYSAAIGFIHTGYPLAFVHDLADLWKMELAAPVAFRIVAEDDGDVGTRARHAMRDAFRAKNLLETIIPSIERILDAGEGSHGRPEELGGAREEATMPEDFPWQSKDSNKDRSEAAASTDAPDPRHRWNPDLLPDEEDEVETRSDEAREAPSSRDRPAGPDVDPLGLWEGFKAEW